MDALGSSNDCERRVHLHSLLTGIGFNSDFTGEVGEDGELELTRREACNAARASRHGKGVLLCHKRPPAHGCRFLEKDEDPLCVSCCLKVLDLARQLTAELFGFKLTRKPPYRLDNHTLWPNSGASGARFVADEAFRREMDAALSETDKRTRRSAGQVQQYREMLRGLTQDQLRVLYVREFGKRGCVRRKAMEMQQYTCERRGT